MPKDFPDNFIEYWRRSDDYRDGFADRGELRYGENPHQRAHLYTPEATDGPFGGVEQLQGKEMSHNNWLDADAARMLVSQFDPERPTVVIIKHQNPCGVASADAISEAYRLAVECDPQSAFGGVVAFNQPPDQNTAMVMRDVFTEVAVAPKYQPEFRGILSQKQDLRLLQAPLAESGGREMRSIDGGLLIQERDWVGAEDPTEWDGVTEAKATVEQLSDLVFAWRVVALAKSNGIVLAKGERQVGIGPGQVNRAQSVEIAVQQAESEAEGAVLASDAFFPFPDGLIRAAEAGVAAVVQPGGSKKDAEVIKAADEHGVAMVFTGKRHFRH